MTVQIQANNSQVYGLLSKNNKVNFQGAPTVERTSKCAPTPKQEAPTKVKIASLIGALTGVTLAMTHIFTKKGFAVNSFKAVKDGFMKLHYGGKEILQIAAGSVAGGLVGGLISDKDENAKAKLRESVIQYVGNIFIPLACVCAGSKGYEKIKPYVTEMLPHFKNAKGSLKKANEFINALPSLALSVVTLGIGIIAGNRVGNWINETVFHVKDNRKLRLTDFSPHIDDACLAITLGNPNSPIAHKIARVIPAALTVAGVEVGVAQEKPERCAKNKK